MGLILTVYRHSHGMDCSAGGISSKFTEFTVINCEGPFEPAPDRPPVLLEAHVPGCVRIVPAGEDGKRLNMPEDDNACGPMFGGNYAATSDSRFGEKIRFLLGGAKFYGAVAIHDRYETAAMQGRG